MGARERERERKKSREIRVGIRDGFRVLSRLRAHVFWGRGEQYVYEGTAGFKV